MQLNIWCRPQDRDTIRAYAVSLAEGVTSDTPDETVTSDPPVTSDQPKVKPLPKTVEELKAHAAKVKAETVTSDKGKAERKAARAAKPKKKRNPIPTRCTDNPEQIKRVMLYHRDTSNEGADEKIYHRATIKLINWCDLKTLKELIHFHHPDKNNPGASETYAVYATNELNARKKLRKGYRQDPWTKKWEKRGTAP